MFYQKICENNNLNPYCIKNLKPNFKFYLYENFIHTNSTLYTSHKVIHIAENFHPIEF